MPLQTFPVAAAGGLDLVSSLQVMAQKPGAAVVLENYEVLNEGGYQKVNGLVEWGGLPDAYRLLPIRGFYAFKGVVVVAGEYILHSPDGVSWYVVNRENVLNTPSSVLAESKEKLLPRKGSQYVSFSVAMEGAHKVLAITDDVGAPSFLKLIDDKYSYKESADASVKGMRYVTKYQDHIAIGGSKESPGLVKFSARFLPSDFAGTGSWSVQVQNEITGLHVFRDFLYIFCKDSIYRVSNLESAASVQSRPVTTKIGCLDSRTIQEVGGDVLFLAADGFRYLGATERIDDVSLMVVSQAIRPLVDDIATSKGAVSSVIIPEKAQYRIHYTDKCGAKKGIIGTLVGQNGFQWSTLGDFFVEGVSYDAETGILYSIGSDTTGYPKVYLYDKGNTKAGTPITATWATPYFNMGDGFVRKSLHDIMAYLETTGETHIQVTVKYDHESVNINQPEPFILEQLLLASMYGSARFGESVYGSSVYPIDPLMLEGSGKWIQLRFQDTFQKTPNSTYMFRGYDLQFTQCGRI